LDQSAASGLEQPHVRLVQFLLYPDGKSTTIVPSQSCCRTTHTHTCAELHIVLFPGNYFHLAKQFWQHVGTGISSRLAERCLSFLSPDETSPPSSPTASPPIFPSKNKHYAVSPRSSFYSRENPEAKLGRDEGLYMEERYGRNLCLSSAVSAKRALRWRIAGVIDYHDQSDCPGIEDFTAEISLGLKRVKRVTEDDIYLFPSGMAAIWNAHQLVLAARPPKRSVCFG
jgi:cystathionine gamma-synthase